MTSWWQRVYDSPWHQPALVGLLGVLGLLVLLRGAHEGDRWLRAWGWCFGLEAIVDATLTSNISPLGHGHPALSQALGIVFVILGDARVYLLTERYGHAPPRGGVRPVLAGLGVGAIASVLMAAPARLVPAMQHNPRWIFLAYELLALAQVLLWRQFVLPRRRSGEADAPTARWLHAVTGFVTVQYTLWALADVVILSGSSAGFLLRLVPNVLYYGLFVGYVLRRAPPAIRP